VVRPATPQDNLALLGAAIACDGPVVYMEHKDLWGLTGEVDETARARIGEARLARAGTDVTVVSWSGMVHTALRAAELASAQGVEAEVIDLRTLWPWDRAAVAASVQKTGRLLVVHEAVQVGGFGAEIAAHVAEHQFEDLRAPVRRPGAPRIPIGYAPSLEDQAKVLAERDLGPAILELAGDCR
jgi:acetoin:2,6-dichlorophenolindophenol oxidoreductase subunit beta